MTPPTLRSMPVEAQALRDPWPSVAHLVPGLTPALEQRFRAGQRVSHLERGPVLGGSMKGGSSSVWVPTDEATARAFRGWATFEGFRRDDSRATFDALAKRLAAHGIALLDGHEAQPTPLVFDPTLAEPCRLLEAVLAALPSAHLERPELTGIMMGGWGADAAKASGFRDGVVHLYEFATRGARRTFVGLALHELGHPQERAFSDRARSRLARAHARLAERPESFFGMEYLLSPSTRRSYQQLSLTEFLAETYLAYTAAGAGLRRFMAGLPLTERDAWLTVYATFRDAFSGWEYT